METISHELDKTKRTEGSYLSFGFIVIFFQIEVIHDKLEGVGTRKISSKKGREKMRKEHE